MPNALVLPATTFSYGQKKILDNCSLELPAGSFVLLTGPTGCGKSTLLKILAGLIPSKVEAKGKTALLFQNPLLQFALPTLYDELIFALENEQVGKEAAFKRIKQATKDADVEKMLHRPFAQLSGGERQRAALSVLLAMDADVLLLDEPFANCDPANRKKLLAVLASLHAAGKTIVAADHDWHGYTDCDQVWRFEDGQVNVEEPQTFFKEKKTELPHYHFELPQESKEETKAFQISNLSFGYEQTLVAQERLSLPKGQATWLTGANGSGKSTFLNVLSKLTPYQGQIVYGQKDLARWAKRQYLGQVGQVFQMSSQQFLTANVNDELTLSLKAQRPGFFDQEKSKKLITDFGLDRLRKQSPYLLSGGQQKLLQLACMLLLNRPVLLLDEPLAGLDEAYAAKAAYWLKEAQQAGQTQLIVSHQPLAYDQCAYHLVLQDGRFHYVQN
jgi:energy-coupling factor transporter ATP-binding protein EcfA2